MPINYPRTKPGFHGVQRFTLQTGAFGGTNFLGGATPFTANATTKVFAGSPFTKSRFSGFTFTIGTTVPVDSDGTLTVTAIKYNATTNAEVTISAAVSLEGVTLREAVRTLALSTATDAALTFNSGDTLEFHVISDSAAIDTAAAGVVFVGEFLCLE